LTFSSKKKIDVDDDPSIESGNDIIQHDPPAGRHVFNLSYGKRLRDIEKSKQKEADAEERPFRRQKKQRKKLSGRFIYDHGPGVFIIQTGGHQ
jgi:hypothetical protein